MMKVYFSFAILILGTFAVQAQVERKNIRKGSEEFANKNYAESEAQFRQALAKNNKSYEAQFNIADALYKQDKFAEALQAFQALASKETDKTRLAALNHNIGNCHLSMATQKKPGANGQDAQANADQGAGLDKAIDSYKTSLKNNPLDNETRYNLIAAEKMKDQNKNKDKQKQDQKQDQQHQQQQQQEQTSKQDAQRILEAMQQEEKQLQDKRKVKAQGKQSDKNW